MSRSLYCIIISKFIEVKHALNKLIFFSRHWYCSLDVHKSDNYVVAGANNGLTHLLSKTGEPVSSE